MLISLISHHDLDRQYRSLSQPSLTPIRWLITPIAAIAAFIASHELFSAFIALVKPTLLPSLVLYAARDWSSTTFALLTAVEIAPHKKGTVAIVSAVALCSWHAALLLVAPQHPVAAQYSHETITVTCLVGFVIAGFLAYRIEQRERFEIPGDELMQIMLKQLAESRELLEAEAREDETVEDYFQMDDADAPAPQAVDRDMILLERELRYVDLPRTAYISAIRFAIAVERDANFRNCKGEHLLFHQIVLDSAMRLSVMNESESFWKTTAQKFRNYESLSDLERALALSQTESILPVEIEPEPTEAMLQREQDAELLEVAANLGLKTEYALNT